MEDFKFDTLNYVRPDFSHMKEIYEQAALQITSAPTYEALKKTMLLVEDAQNHFITMTTIASIRNTLDTTNEFYETEHQYNETSYPTIMESEMAYKSALLHSSYHSQLLEEYGEELFLQIQRELDSFNPVLVPFLQQESLLCNQYQKLMATAQIPFQNEVHNLYGIQKFFEHPNREIRKQAFCAFSGFFQDNEAKMEEIFGELIDVRTKMGRALKDADFIPLGYKLQGRSDYGEKEVAAFREQVLTEIVPLCTKLYEAQSKRIGIKDFKVYDEQFLFPDGNAIPAGDDNYMIAKAKEMYHELSPETGEFIDFMIDHQLMNLKNTPNKASTGYMTFLFDYNAPYVFSCFNQTIGDMQVLSHELGHAFAGYQAMRHQPLSSYCGSSTDIMEIHSMAMEQFAYPYADKFFGKDADKYRFAHLQDAITFVPFGVAVDEFQHIIYKNPSLTPKERTYEWHKLEEKYMPWRTYEDDAFMERGGYWYHKIHIFLYPFYYINYTLTTIGAMEFKKRYAENPKQAWQDYLALCNAGGSLNYLSLLKNAHLSVPFEEGSVKQAISYAKDILLNEIQKIES